jgi:peptidoglycan/LPS O-acetylase OafA/YrhL
MPLEWAPVLLRTTRLGIAERSKENSIGLLRFLFAAAVLYSHSFTLGGFGPEPVQVMSAHRESLGSLMVQCFFVLSGFLITRSCARGGSIGRFLWHRLLRIMPGYWVCLLVTAVVFGPIHYWSVTHTLAGYFSGADQGPIAYVLSNYTLRIRQWGILGLPAGIPFPGAFDGALWSLFYEFRCYLLVAVLGLLGLLRRFAPVGVVVVLALAVAPTAAVWLPAAVPWVASLGDTFMLGLVPYFFAGALFFMLRRFIVLGPWQAAVAFGVVIASLRFSDAAVARPVALGFLIFWLGYRLPFVHFDARGDFSYGIYIYAFPVQQTLAMWRVNRFGITTYVIASSALTLVLAVLSYRLVERPFLRLKNLRVPIPRVLTEAIMRRLRPLARLANEPPPSSFRPGPAEPSVPADRREQLPHASPQR